MKLCAPGWPSWSTAGSAAWAACSTLKTGEQHFRDRNPDFMTSKHNSVIPLYFSGQVWRWLHHHPASGRARPRPSAGDELHRAGASREHSEREAPQHAAVPAPLIPHLPSPHLLPPLKEQGDTLHRRLFRLPDHFRPSKQMLRTCHWSCANKCPPPAKWRLCSLSL